MHFESRNGIKKDGDSSNINPFGDEEELFSVFMAMKAMV
jgi:hypothetical protein